MFYSGEPRLKERALQFGKDKQNRGMFGPIGVPVQTRCHGNLWQGPACQVPLGCFIFDVTHFPQSALVIGASKARRTHDSRAVSRELFSFFCGGLSSKMCVSCFGIVKFMYLTLVRARLGAVRTC